MRNAKNQEYHSTITNLKIRTFVLSSVVKNINRQIVYKSVLGPLHLTALATRKI